MLILKLFHFRQLNGQQPADSPGGVVFRKLGPTTQRRRQGLGRTGVGKTLISLLSVETCERQL